MKRIDLSFGDADGVTTDDDLSTRTPTEAEWQRLERDIEDLHRDASAQDKAATVTRNVKLIGIISDTLRQVDVLIEGTLARQPMRIAVECKHYKNPVGIKTVEAFIGMLLDLDVHKGAIWALNGFTGPARKRAEGSHHPELALYDVDVTRDEPLDYTDLLFDSDCPNDTCYAEIYGWWAFKAESGEEMQVGRCETCGTVAFRCFTCGSLVAADGDSVECFDCQSSYELERERDSRDIEYALWRFRDEVLDFAAPQLGYDRDVDDSTTDGVPVRYVFRDAWSGEPKAAS